MVDPAPEIEPAALFLPLVAVVGRGVAVHACEPTAQALAQLRLLLRFGWGWWWRHNLLELLQVFKDFLHLWDIDIVAECRHLLLDVIGSNVALGLKFVVLLDKMLRFGADFAGRVLPRLTRRGLT